MKKCVVFLITGNIYLFALLILLICKYQQLRFMIRDIFRCYEMRRAVQAATESRNGGFRTFAL